ncbi:hypothetical protein [Chryseobacterium sp. BGARF1]|uniref:hypothetical protein n=1 Tax=Chryseobacterium sp. BGARF1 TaxID=1664319 RepID=UPI000832020E|nr:hypothetical protein [Chryseobacterium sp. BGARF1]
MDLAGGISKILKVSDEQNTSNRRRENVISGLRIAKITVDFLYENIKIELKLLPNSFNFPR